MKTIGVLGGIGPQATMDFEQRLHQAAQRLLPRQGNSGYPPLVVYYHRRPPVLVDEAGRSILPLTPDPQLLDGARKLGQIVDFLVITSNGAHLLQPAIEEAAGRPVLSMIEATVAEVVRRGWRYVGVLSFMGYASNNDNTLVDYGFGDCPGRAPQPIPLPSAYTNGVVTPHAVFLALDFAPEDSLANLEKLRQNFDVYGPWGFWDSVNVSTGEVARFVLALDQGMVMMALGNALRNDRLQAYFAHGMVEEAIRPLLEMEEFTAGAASGIAVDAFPVHWPLPLYKEQEEAVH